MLQIFSRDSPTLPYKARVVYIVYESVVNHHVHVARGMCVETRDQSQQPCAADKQIHTDHNRVHTNPNHHNWSRWRWHLVCHWKTKSHRRSARCVAHIQHDHRTGAVCQHRQRVGQFQMVPQETPTNTWHWWSDRVNGQHSRTRVSGVGSLRLLNTISNRKRLRRYIYYYDESTRN